MSRKARAGRQQVQRKIAPVPPAPQPGFSQITVTASESRQLTYQSPIPPPEVLEQYEVLVPGASKRILEMAESQTAHRQSLELKNVTSTIRRAYIGQVSALLIGLVGLGGVLFAISCV